MADFGGPTLDLRGYADPSAHRLPSLTFTVDTRAGWPEDAAQVGRALDEVIEERFGAYIQRVKGLSAAPFPDLGVRLGYDHGKSVAEFLHEPAAKRLDLEPHIFVNPVDMRLRGLRADAALPAANFYLPHELGHVFDWYLGLINKRAINAAYDAHGGDLAKLYPDQMTGMLTAQELNPVLLESFIDGLGLNIARKFGVPGELGLDSDAVMARFLRGFAFTFHNELERIKHVMPAYGQYAQQRRFFGWVRQQAAAENLLQIAEELELVQEGALIRAKLAEIDGLISAQRKAAGGEELYRISLAMLSEAFRFGRDLDLEEEVRVSLAKE